MGFFIPLITIFREGVRTIPRVFSNKIQDKILLTQNLLAKAENFRTKTIPQANFALSKDFCFRPQTRFAETED